MLHNQTDRKFKLEIAVNNNQKTTRLIELDIPLTDRQAHLTPGFVTTCTSAASANGQIITISCFTPIQTTERD